MFDDFKRPPKRPEVKLDTYRDNMPAPGNQNSEDEYKSNTPRRDFSTYNNNNYPQPFRTPEETTANDPQSAEPQPQVAPAAMPASHFLPPLEDHPQLSAHIQEPPKRKFFRFHRPDLTRKQWIIVGTVFAVLIGSATTFALTRKETAPPVVKAPVKAKAVPKPVPKPILSPLSGMPVTLEQQIRPVTGVMVENSTNARPQSGLDQAGIVFEAIAEAGITRFLALYQETNPATVGPVRSARPYYLDWAMAFDANYAHVGGSPDALQLIKDRGVRDLDQFYNSGAYRRTSNRFAPHNMYTGLDALIAAGNAKGYTNSTFTPLVRKEKETPATVPSAKSIDMAISSSLYNTRYDYDPATNAYKRSMAGSPHVDNETKAQLAPKVVIALAIPYSLMSDGYHSQYQTTGSGNMLLFQDGTVTAGTWSKGDPKSQFIFKDGAGADMKLNPGQTWITVVGDITKVTYAP